MPTINDLTPEQFKSLLNDYFTHPEKRSKIKYDEIKQLAEQLISRLTKLEFQ